MADTPASSRSRGWFWPLMALGGLVAGATMLLRSHEQAVSATGRHATPPSAMALEAGHETKDINARTTAFILAGMAATTALVTGVVFVMVWRFDAQRHATFANLAPQQTARVVPPAPHLQLDPFADLARLQARENNLLHSYGWTSADRSTARIPIERAMALSVGKSLDAGP